MIEPPEFVRRLAPEPELARNAAFALFTLAYLDAVGLAPAPSGAPLRERVDGVRGTNEHLLASFGDGALRDGLASVDPGAARDLEGWARAQRLEREEAQVAYELGVLALGAALPPVLVRGLRELTLAPDTTVAELPNGAGYPTVFLASLHPQWEAAACATLYVTSIDARQLAAWAMLLLTRRLETPAVVTVDDAGRFAGGTEYDLAVSYNPPAGLDVGRLVRAARLVVV
ncbi:MAG TPA: hypothetical protein VFX49_11965 [Chloroflexota bacterium]|nr:hypothetical protein [Chloroflexota bacterium]